MTEAKLIDYARKTFVSAMQVKNLDRYLTKISRETCRSARKTIKEAIALLQAFEKSLTQRIDG
jgi:hypothetical protein